MHGIQDHDKEKKIINMMVKIEFQINRTFRYLRQVVHVI